MDQHGSPRPASFTLPGMIEVQVRLHGPAADHAPHRDLCLALPQAATTELFWDALVAQIPGLGTLRAQCALAIDNAWAPADALLHEGAVIDIIPPVSGG